MDIMKMPKRRQVRSEIGQTPSGELVVFAKAMSSRVPTTARFEHHNVKFNMVIGNIEPSCAQCIQDHGIIPILERLLLSPEQVNMHQQWFYNAALLLATEHDKTLRFQHDLPLLVVLFAKSM